MNIISAEIGWYVLTDDKNYGNPKGSSARVVLFKIDSNNRVFPLINNQWGEITEPENRGHLSHRLAFIDDISVTDRTHYRVKQ